MKQKVQISGLTCQGCVNSVQDALQQLPGIRSVSVSLETGTARWEADRLFALEEVQSILPPAYTAHDHENNSAASHAPASAARPKWKRLIPLGVALLGIALTALILNAVVPGNRSFMLDFMGLFFLVFSALKLIDYKNFPASFARYDPLASAWVAYAWAYPWIELLLGVLLLSRTGLPYVLGFTVLILGMTTVGVLRALLQKRSIQCACMGTALNLPMTEATLVENVLMIAMAAAALPGLFT